jgi:hypothetical protein
LNCERPKSDNVPNERELSSTLSASPILQLLNS